MSVKESAYDKKFNSNIKMPGSTFQKVRDHFRML